MMLAGIGLVLAAAGGAGVILVRLLWMRRSRRGATGSEIAVIVLFPIALLTLVLVSVWDEPLTRASPLLAGGAMTVVLASLGAYALWLAHRYRSSAQGAVGLVALAGALIGFVLTLLAVGVRVAG